MRAAIEDDLWRIAEIGRFKQWQLGPVSPAGRIDGLLDGDDGQVRVSAVCVQRPVAPAAVIVMQPVRGSASLVERMARAIVWPPSLETRAGR